ncbi:MAG: LTA synthase family protein [Paramuribaculum sp.]|nr:LTA synthase family protein [Paramuribaculum sp.]
MSWTAFTAHISDTGTPNLFFHYAFRYWGILLTWLVFILTMIWLICRVTVVPQIIRRSIRVISFIIVIIMTFLCIRGFRLNGRPLSMSMRYLYVDKIIHSSAVINTPFAMAFQLKDISNVPQTYFNDRELSLIRNSLIVPPDTLQPNGKNIMLIVLESGGSIHSDIFSPVGATPYSSSMSFVDSLTRESLINLHFYGSGRSSAQGITQLLAGVPFFGSGESYYVNSKQSDIPKDTPAILLKSIGYDTRFYYGCDEGNFHIDETAKVSGFDNLFNRGTFGDDSQYDGVWGIWDKPMGKYVAEDLSQVSKPFFATWFTVTAHSPYTLPDSEDISNYKYTEGPAQSMEYTDRAIRSFFNIARLQSWYCNTIFIITSDHGQRDYFGSEYSEDPYVSNHLPFIIFAPDGSIPNQIITDTPMGQIDVAPTILHLAGYNEPYISMGSSLFDNTKGHYALASLCSAYYVYGTKYMVAFEAPDKLFAVYDIRETPYPHTELTEYDLQEINRMSDWFKALMQDYTERIYNNRMQYQ